ncbi:MAG: hypothetical protein CUN55_13410 [Phototrophicales bacterium]|nr:MAG: hypothetical protein CUN55_13410 [Phototrophicales bacterium]
MSNQEELLYDPRVAQSSSHGLIFAAIVAVFLLGGIAFGLFYAWELSPVVEQDTRPDQLRMEERLHYVGAIALDYAYLRDRNRTYNLLLAVDPSADPFQLAVDTVCEMTRRGRVQTSGDIEIIRSLIAFFSAQPNVSIGCDIQVFATSSAPNLPTATPNRSVPTVTPIPVFTKTPTQSANIPTTPPERFPSPTLPSDEFIVLQTSRFCSPNASGVIEIRVRRANFGDGIAGVPVEVQWNSPTGQRSQIFYTGLKPDRDAGYADFQMQEGLTYQVRLFNLSGLTERLEAVPCDEDGTLRSYQIIFQSR